MRFLSTLFCFLLSLTGFAQEIQELPLLANPILIEKTRRQVENFEATLKKIEKNTPAKVLGESDILRGGKKFQDTVYILSGEDYDIVIDTAGLFLDTLYLNNTTFNFADSVLYNKKVKTNKFTYFSKKGIVLGRDTLSMILKPFKDPIDTVNVLIIVKRNGKTDARKPITYLQAEKDTIICVPTDGLTGKLVSSELRSCVTESIALEQRKAYGKIDTCIYYRASRLGGLDTSCLILCDENRVCDTLLFPIKVLQDTLTATISETFLDDFSYKGPYPDEKMWLNDRVYVNNTMTIKPPSIGMATFDGLDYTGRPYGNGQGVSDVLTSAYLDLSNANTVHYLSYYAEPKGLGYSPSPLEPFIVEFKTKDNQWVFADSIICPRIFLVNEAPPGFKFKVVEIKKDFLYKGFQFRFRSFSSRTGINDVWNLDYVRLSKESPVQSGSSEGFRDVALTQSPGYIFKNYTAAPWKHIRGFENQELNDSISVNVYNHFKTDVPITDSNVEINELKTNQNLVTGEDIVPVALRNLLPFSHLNKLIEMSNQSKTNLADKVKNIPATAENLEFVSELSIKIGTGQENIPAVLRNDKVQNNSISSNYFAYDDGTAESVISSKGTEVQVQVQFRANVEDSLRAIAIHFPHFNRDISYMKFNLRVFVGTLNGVPVYEKLFINPDYPDRYEPGFQGFTQYVLTDNQGKPKPVFIPKGNFYVGWQVSTNSDEPFVIGFDKNNPTGTNHIWSNTTGVWKQSASKGAIMIRPKLSSTAKQVLAAKTNETAFGATVFPNPANDYFNVSVSGADISNLNYSITDLSGKTIQQGILTEVIDTQNLINGLYILTIQHKKENKAYRQKISIIR